MIRIRYLILVFLFSVVIDILIHKEYNIEEKRCSGNGQSSF
jgi:hypothetical protein